MITIIVYDNGSGRMINPLSAQVDKGYEVLSVTGKNAAEAFNKGLRQTQNEYVWFVQSNDQVGVNALDNITKILKSNHPDVAVFDFKQRYDGDRIEQLRPNTYSAPAGAFVPMLAQGKYPSTLCHKIFRTKMLRDAAISFNEQLSVFYENEFLLKLYSCNTSIITLYAQQNIVTHPTIDLPMQYDRPRFVISQAGKDEYPLYLQLVKQILGRKYNQILDAETFDYKYALSNNGLLDRKAFNLYLPTPLWMMLRKPYKFTRLLKYVAVYIVNKFMIK